MRSSSSSAVGGTEENRLAAQSNTLVERLVRTVARAFYTDSFLVVFDTLIQEKYLREEEFAPRLRLPDKDVKKVLAQLESEMLIRSEDMVMDDGRTAKCYYIDYQLFVNVVRYRIHLMEKKIEAAERSELNEVFFQCPTCANRYTSLEAQKLLSADFKFICSYCCPEPSLSRAISQDFFRLIEIDNRSKMNDVQQLEKKFSDQLSETEHHEGIFDLLHALRDRSLIRNLPSENRLRGIVTSRVVDVDIQDEIDYKMSSKVVNKVVKKHIGTVQPTLGHNGHAFTLNIESESNQHISSSNNGQQNATQKRLREASLPEFLKESRVKTAEDLLRESFALPGNIIPPSYTLSFPLPSTMFLSSTLCNHNLLFYSIMYTGDATSSSSFHGDGSHAMDTNEGENKTGDADDDDDVAWED